MRPRRVAWLILLAPGACAVGIFPLTFRKTATQTVSDIVRKQYPRDNATSASSCEFSSFWHCEKGKFCHPLLLGHNSLQLYATYGHDRLLETCAKTRVRFVVVLRNPLEQLSSALFFWGYGGGSKKTPFPQELLDTLLQFPSPANISDMRIMVRTLRRAFHFVPHEYVRVLGRQRHFLQSSPFTVSARRLAAAGDDALDEGRRKLPVEPSSDDVTRAKANLDRFDIVGTTEHMSSFLMLLTATMGWPSNVGCVGEQGHGMGLVYQRLFGTAQRPSVERLYRPAVVAYLKRYLAPDIEVHAHAEAIHRRQIRDALAASSLQQTVGDAREFAEARWRGECCPICDWCASCGEGGM